MLVHDKHQWRSAKYIIIGASNALVTIPLNGNREIKKESYTEKGVFLLSKSL